MVANEKNEEEKEENIQPTNIGNGDKPQTTKLIDDANLAAKRLEDANKEKRELLEQEQKLLIERRLGGVAEGGQDQPKPKKLTDEEYAEALQRGEVDPLREDGFAK